MQLESVLEDLSKKLAFKEGLDAYKVKAESYANKIEQINTFKTFDIDVRSTMVFKVIEFAENVQKKQALSSRKIVLTESVLEKTEDLSKQAIASSQKLLDPFVDFRQAVLLNIQQKTLEIKVANKAAVTVETLIEKVLKMKDLEQSMIESYAIPSHSSRVIEKARERAESFVKKLKFIVQAQFREAVLQKKLDLIKKLFPHVREYTAERIILFKNFLQEVEETLDSENLIQQQKMIEIGDFFLRNSLTYKNQIVIHVSQMLSIKPYLFSFMGVLIREKKPKAFSYFLNHCQNQNTWGVIEGRLVFSLKKIAIATSSLQFVSLLLEKGIDMEECDFVDIEPLNISLDKRRLTQGRLTEARLMEIGFSREKIKSCAKERLLAESLLTEHKLGELLHPFYFTLVVLNQACREQFALNPSQSIIQKLLDISDLSNISAALAAASNFPCVFEEYRFSGYPAGVYVLDSKMAADKMFEVEVLPKNKGNLSIVYYPTSENLSASEKSDLNCLKAVHEAFQKKLKCLEDVELENNYKKLDSQATLLYKGGCADNNKDAINAEVLCLRGLIFLSIIKTSRNTKESARHWDDFKKILFRLCHAYKTLGDVQKKIFLIKQYDDVLKALDHQVELRDLIIHVSQEQSPKKAVISLKDPEMLKLMARTINQLSRNGPDANQGTKKPEKLKKLDKKIVIA